MQALSQVSGDRRFTGQSGHYKGIKKKTKEKKAIKKQRKKKQERKKVGKTNKETKKTAKALVMQAYSADAADESETRGSFFLRMSFHPIPHDKNTTRAAAAAAT